MTRKSKHAGGNLPLTHFEANKKFRSSSDYGTTTARLSTDSQGSFGDCGLSLSPAVDPVATPSGHIYSREAIVEYLLTKTTELKEARKRYEAFLAKQKAKSDEEGRKKQADEVQSFEDSQKATTSTKKKRKREENALKGSSYWLAEFQPEADEELPPPPPERPPSPFTGNPLRRKDLQPLQLERKDGKVVCAVSQKTIVTQPVVALCAAKDAPGHVVLEQEVFNKLVKPTMVCPITGKKLKSKHILHLERGKSGFASSGIVEAKIYRPTIT